MPMTAEQRAEVKWWRECKKHLGVGPEGIWPHLPDRKRNVRIRGITEVR